MALIKSILNKKLDSVEYWKIVKRNISDLDGTTEIVIYGWGNKNRRIQSPNYPDDYRIFIIDKVFTEDGKRSELYTELKQEKYGFDKAEDD